MSHQTGKFVHFADGRLFILPEAMQHKFCHAFGNNIISAGFVSIHSGEAYGHSFSLEMSSIPELDTPALQKMLAGEMFIADLSRFDLPMSNTFTEELFNIPCKFSEMFIASSDYAAQKFDSRLRIAYQMF